MRRPGGFQTVELNLYGWSALIGTGFAIGAIAALVAHLPLWIALIGGVVATWAMLRIVDRHRYRNSTVHLADDRFDPETGAAVVARLAELDIAATYREYLFDDEDGTIAQRGILCRQADIASVRTVMSQHFP
jgi:hypothetical protein